MLWAIHYGDVILNRRHRRDAYTTRSALGSLRRPFVNQIALQCIAIKAIVRNTTMIHMNIHVKACRLFPVVSYVSKISYDFPPVVQMEANGRRGGGGAS